MDREAFRADLLNAVVTRSEIDQIWTANAFLEELKVRLAEAEEIEDASTLNFEGEGKSGRKLAVHGYDLDDSDNSIALVVLHFDGGPGLPTFTGTEASKRLRALQGFLEEALSGDFRVGREPSYQEYQLAEDLRKRGRNVSRYRLYLVSDALLSSSAKAMESTELNGVPVDYHIWDLRRFHQVAESLSGRDELVIDIREWLPSGLPALEVADRSSEIRSYLAAVPADMLADLYGRHGSRLLEGNVRSYLSNRGGVNKGIRTTVLSDPASFLAYNNGVTATAVDVEAVEGRLISITDLQIVNGGQTTASLFYVKRENKTAPMPDVFVQMKLVVVEPDTAEEMIPKISRYANSQNRVSEADFFSNSPFHVRLAELSHRVLVPAQSGVNYQTKWFYERTRGSYQNEKSKRSIAEQRKFEAEYPRKQVIDKTSAAKYEVTWGMQPHKVSAGAQKNFMAFADLVARKWEAAPAAFNELYWKHLVAKGILFEQVRLAIAKADWYEKGYLANYVTYTIAKLAYEVGRQTKSGAFDLDTIWNSQSVNEIVLRECLAIGHKVQAILTSERRPVQNVTEWAKREACWELVREMKHALSGEFLGQVGSREVVSDRRRAAEKVQKIDDGIAAQTKVVTMQPSEWVAVQEFGTTHRLVSPKDMDLLAYVTGRKSGFPTDAQCRVLLGLLQKCIDHGYDPD
ncbi:hypothetical protein GCM10011492_05890 [Flexivirga endophytica]|uniref:AIPR protein n=1 Tax=Flexivirga endophytica TaxID=1849103 RepID=A0A916SVK9_9MICO|nr:AIPR family protein [Flexivirga endophytica]GGB18850.1 hypothetical protein GCM10011492_05890 [Flexivirga endophytica]GHB36814.1 hypothetical protein GCM10008112_01710 [Flexivirga endophytica]